MAIISKNKEKHCQIFHGIMPLDGGVPSVGPLGTTLGEAYFGNGLIPKHHHPTLDDQPCGTWKFQRTFDKNLVRTIYIYIMEGCTNLNVYIYNFNLTTSFLY
jgi:hypothetical protein